jgi:copper chaperone CopZ
MARWTSEKGCPHVIKQSLAAVPGVINVTVSDKTKTAAVTFDDTKADVKALTEATTAAGYPSFLSYGRDAVAVKNRALIACDSHDMKG